MKVCCCSLAGTRACDNCRNGASEVLFNPVTIFLGIAERIPDQPTFWSTTSLSDVYEKTKNRKSK